MLDDSLIDYMKRMQGRKISVQLDKDLLRGTEPAFKVDTVVRNGLDTWKNLSHNVAQREEVVHVFMSSWVQKPGTKEMDLQNYILSYVPRYMRGNLPFDIARPYLPDNNGRNEMAFQTTVFNMRSEDAWESVRRGQYAGSMIIYRLDPKAKTRTMVQVSERYSESWARFKRAFMDSDMEKYNSFHIVSTIKAFALDIHGIVREMNEFANETGYKVSELSWRDWSWGPWPSDTWYDHAVEVDRDGNEEIIMPDLPKFNMMSHGYFRDTNDPKVYLPGPGSPHAKDVDTDFDGKWYTYRIPQLDMKESHVDIVEDFNKFLVSMLGR